MYKDYYDDIIPPENYEPEVLLELNIGKIETKLLFQGEEIVEPVVVNNVDNSSFESRLAILAALKNLDIGIGAVVTKRANYPSTRVMPLYWGIVTNMVSYIHDKITYRPYMVRWIDGTMSYHIYNELILISYAPDEDELALIKLEPGANNHV